MHKPVEFVEAASAELEDAFGWYFERSEKVASEFLEEVERALDVIAVNPARWPAGPHNTRRYLLQRFPFSIVYRELDHIQVVAVAHGRRRPGYWKKRT